MPIDTLMTAAELAVGIAGFTAVAIALGRMGVDSARDRLDVFLMLSIPLGALMFSLLPVVLTYLHVDSSVTLRVSSGAMVACFVAWYVYAYSRTGVEARTETPLSIGLTLVAAANGLAQLCNAIFLSPEWHFGVYFAGVAWLQIAAVSVLLWTIRARSGGADE